MVRTFVSKNLRGQWSLKSMREAVAAVISGGNLRTVAKQYNVPRNTLRRHVCAHSNGQEVVKQIGKRTVLTANQEDELVKVVLSLESHLFGLSLQDLRRLVFQFCERNQITHPFNRDREMAGEDWARQFLKRHSNLSVRKPEGMSIGRAIGFNKEKTKRFYEVLKCVLFQGETLFIPDCNLYNVDETGLTICQKPQKVVAERGKRCVATLISAEKGKTVTVICCVSATGTYVPPMMIFPRVRMKPELIDKAPNGTVGAATKSGWVNEEKFLEWFDHFIKYVQPKSRDRPVVLIMDGHSSHTKNLLLIEKARQNNVILLSLPSHCTHRMQPLDVSIFKSLKTYYNQEVQCWLRRHPGRPVTEYQIAELFAVAYGKSATVGNATSGYRDTGIVPFNADIFSDVDFVAAGMTEREEEEQETVHGMSTLIEESGRQPDSPLPVDDNNSDHHQASPTYITVPVDNRPSIDIQQLILEVVTIPQDSNYDCLPIDATSSAQDGNVSAAGSVDSNSDHHQVIAVPVGQTSDNRQKSSEVLTNSSNGQPSASALADHQPSTSADVASPFVPATFYGIIEESQTPYQRSKGAVKRKVVHALNLTSSPYKAELGLQQSKKKKVADGRTKQQKKTSRPRRKLDLHGDDENSNSTKQASSREPIKNSWAKRLTTADKRMQGKKTEKCVRKGKNRNTSSNKISKQERRSSKTGDKLTANKPNDIACLYCFDTVDEDWIQCTRCCKWAHTACAGVDEDELYYVCEQCR